MELAASPADAKCWKFHHGCTEVTAPSRHFITNVHRQRIGDLYNDGLGRIQIRDNNRVIRGYIERDGSVEKMRRQKVGSVESLGLIED